MKNGEMVSRFERAFAEYVQAKYAIALCNGTATLHTALVALGVKPGDRVAVPPLTHSATTIAVLHAGAVPVFTDVDPMLWTMEDSFDGEHVAAAIPVSLYGLHSGYGSNRGCPGVIDDAAQTLKPHSAKPGPCAPPAFTSYSFQASKILPLGEGGMLCTDDEALATEAREFSSLGYRMRADQPRIDPAVLKSPTFERHHSLGWNYRMNDLTAEEGSRRLLKTIDVPFVEWDALEFGRHSHRYTGAEALVEQRRRAAQCYAQVVASCPWLTPQHVPDGWGHDYWTYAVACDTPEQARILADEVVASGGERPYPAWRLTYQEPAFRHLAEDGTCPVAESLQPRLLQFQTNRLDSVAQNATALQRAIAEMT